MEDSDHIPSGLRPFFQEYDVDTLDLKRDAVLIIQRTLEFGTWEEINWLIGFYGMPEIRAFIKQHGERFLNMPTFNFWRKLLKIRKWKKSPFPTPKGELWKY